MSGGDDDEDEDEEQGQLPEEGVAGRGEFEAGRA